jgi:hypothetical protein
MDCRVGDLAVGTHIAEWQLEILQTCALARCHEGANTPAESSHTGSLDMLSL